METLALPPYSKISKILDIKHIPDDYRDRFYFKVNDEFVSGGDYILMPSDRVEVYYYPGAVIIPALVSWGVSTAVSAGMWAIAGSATWVTATTIAIIPALSGMIAGMLVSSLISPSQSFNRSGDNFTRPASDAPESQTYTFSGAKNTAKPYGRCPVIYGIHRFTPNMGSTPLMENIGNTSRITALYDFGLNESGTTQIYDVMLGDQPLDTIAGTNSYNILPNTLGTDFKYVSKSLTYDALAIKLIKDQAVVIRTEKNAKAATVDVTFPRGLVSYDAAGNRKNQSAGFQFFYREVGTSSWTRILPKSIRGIPVSSGGGYTWGPFEYTAPTTPGNWLYSSGTYIFNTNWQSSSGSGCVAGIQYGGRQLGSMECTDSEKWVGGVGYRKGAVRTSGTGAKWKTTYFELQRTQAISSSVTALTSNTGQQVTASIHIDFPTEGTYEFQLIRKTDTAAANNVYDESVVTMIKSYRAGKVVDLKKRHAMLELSAVASEKLASVDNLTAMVAKAVRTCTATGWGPEELTSNPAYIALDILAGIGNDKPLKDDQIDFASFYELAQVCDQQVTTVINGVTEKRPRYECNIVFDWELNVREAVETVLGNARAALRLLSNGRFGVLYDGLEIANPPKQLFTSANSWNHNGERAFTKLPDGFYVRFISPDANWSWQEFPVYLPGKDASNATYMEDLSTIGVTDYVHAFRYARYMLNAGILRSETLAITASVDNLVVARGDHVLVQTDILKQGGVSGRVAEVTGTTIRLDREFALPAGAGYTVRTLDGLIKTGSIVSQPDLSTIQIATADPDITDDCLISIGELATHTKEYVVQSIEPEVNLNATLRLLPHDDQIYDLGNVPDWDPGFGTDLIGGSDLVVKNVQSTQEIIHVGRLPYNHLELTWKTDGAVGTVDHYVVSVSVEGGEPVQIGTVSGNRFTWDIDLLNRPDLAKKDVSFTVLPVNSLGSQGTAGKHDTNIKVDDVKPKGVEGYGVNVINNSLVEIFWHHPDEPDINSYEIRYSPDTVHPDWNISQRLSNVLYPNDRTTGGARTGSYGIRVKDTSGNLSDVQWLRTSVETLPDLDIIKDIDESGTWPGRLSNMVMDRGYPQLSGSCGSFDSLGYYYFDETFDAGHVQELRVMAMIEGMGATCGKVMADWLPLSSGEAVPISGLAFTADDYDYWLEVRTADKMVVMADWTPLTDASADPLAKTGAAWQPWRRVESADLTGQLFQFRVACQSNDPRVTVRLIGGAVRIDVMERTWALHDESIPVGGKTITYTPAFRETPSLAVTIDGNEYDVTHNITAKSNRDFHLQLVDNRTGNPIAGQIDAIAVGFGRLRTNPI